MASHTIKVTGVSEELLTLLDERVRHQHANGRAEYIRELIRRDVLAPIAAVPAGTGRSFRDILASVHAEGQGESEADTETFLRDELRAHRRESRSRSGGAQ